MAFCDTIVQFINDTLKAGSLNSSKFQPAAYHGITTLIARKRQDGALQLMPGVADNDGNYKSVEPNDKYRLIVYHKTVSSTYQYMKPDSYGDQLRVKSTTDLLLTVWGDCKKIQLNPEQIEAVVISGFPQQLPADVRRSTGVISCLITPVSTDMDKLRVFRQEYQNFDFFLRPQHTLFQLRYRVELVFDQRCLETCGCG